MEVPDLAQHRLLTAKLQSILAELQHGGPATVSVITDRWIGHLIVDPAPKPIKGKRRPDMEVAIEKALWGGKVLVAKEIAKATGYAYNSRLRMCLTELARRNFIVRTPDGYKLV